MAASTFSSVSAMLASVKDDPLPVEERNARRMLMLALLGTPDNGSTARDYLVFYAKELSQHTPVKLVSMFPEKEFSVLTLIEYLLNFVKVIMIDPKDILSDVSDVMDYWKYTIQSLKGLLKKSSLLDVEAASRVEACYKDIVNAVQHCKQLEGESESCDDTEADDPNPWPRFFITHFLSNVEKGFMTRLREIYATALEFPSEDRFQDIEDLCIATDLSHVTNSDLQTYAAMQMMITLVEQALDCGCSQGLNLERYNFLMSSFATLNSSSFPKGTVSACFRDFAAYRVMRVRALLERAHNIFRDHFDGNIFLTSKSSGSTFKLRDVSAGQSFLNQKFRNASTYKLSKPTDCLKFVNCNIPSSSTTALEPKWTSLDLAKSFTDMSLSTS